MKKNISLSVALLVLILILPGVSFAESTYQFIIKKTEIAPRKSNNKRWDFGIGKTRLPDIQIFITIGKTVLKTPLRKNTLRPSWHWKRQLKLRGDEWVHIRVIDRDLKRHDVIGDKRVLLPRLLKSKALAFGGVRKLVLKIIPPRTLVPKKRQVVKALKGRIQSKAKKAKKRSTQPNPRKKPKSSNQKPKRTHKTSKKPTKQVKNPTSQKAKSKKSPSSK